MEKMWGGRFTATANELAEKFNASIDFDKRLVKEDILGSIAHARMLGKQSIISNSDAELIISGLESILQDAINGNLTFNVSDEDIHMNVERILTERIGKTGKKLHTGRSRNDQVALDIRLYMRTEIKEDIAALKELLSVIVKIAKDNTETIIPAYTHMQKAQPTTLAHYLLAYAEMFLRDITRYSDCNKRTDVMPLGSGALCATTYPLDRKMVANELGFSKITNNSIDGVSDRDFLIEYLSCSSICMMHLSRFCEEIIINSTNEFGTITISDAFSTGSSIMPQKKNPDMAELIRGKTGRVYGDLISLLTTMKGLPLAYNKDMQEDKECVFDACDTILACIKIFTEMLSTISWNKDKLLSSAKLGFTNATDVADYLVKKGLPFRDAHRVVGKLVLHCENNNCAISDVTLDTLKGFCELFDADIYAETDVITCVKKRNVTGGPSPDETIKHIEYLEDVLKHI